ncbi:MAG: hypothetical protein U5J63_05565 [Fodinibius sp.]|nr:hypothetical protein [Fodinibius sp.]
MLSGGRGGKLHINTAIEAGRSAGLHPEHYILTAMPVTYGNTVGKGFVTSSSKLAVSS